MIDFKLLIDKALKLGFEDIEIIEKSKKSLEISLFDSKVDQNVLSSNNSISVRALYNEKMVNMNIENFDIDIDEVLNKLNSWRDKIIAVKGNCDDVNDLECVNFPVCENYLVIKVDGKNWYLTHGHLNYKLPELTDEDILFNGHTHCYELSRNYITCNFQL